MTPPDVRLYPFGLCVDATVAKPTYTFTNFLNPLKRYLYSPFFLFSIMFLRRKKSNLNDAVVPQAAYHSNAQPAASTPLYERFATTTRGAASAPTSPGRSSAGISRPMALGVKPGMVGGMGASSSRAGLEARTGVSVSSSFIRFAENLDKGTAASKTYNH